LLIDLAGTGPLGGAGDTGLAAFPATGIVGVGTPAGRARCGGIAGSLCPARHRGRQRAAAPSCDQPEQPQRWPDHVGLWMASNRLALPAAATQGCPAQRGSCRRTCHRGDRCRALRVEPTAVDECGQPPPVAANASGSEDQRARGWPISTRRPAASTPNSGNRFAGRPPLAVSAAQICAIQLRQRPSAS
jgi:hypothetical protein